MAETYYHSQARLLIQVLPLIDHYPVFALKGGTAINFFLRDMPRLSVDIDLTYTRLDGRDTALAAINDTLEGLKADIEHLIAGSTVIAKKLQGRIVTLMVKSRNVMIKIEPNLVLRGTIFEPKKLSLRKAVEDLFGMTASLKVLGAEEIYGGKICAALDRQHPRDLFDIKLLLENEGITEAIRKSFIIHLVSHDRPMAELLNPNFVGLEKTFNADFEGMTILKVSREELEDTRDGLVKTIKEGLTDAERQFILSIKKGEPDWTLIGFEGVERLPAIQWKLLNIKKMDKGKHKQALKKLEACIGC